jgi:hypothetical protein
VSAAGSPRALEIPVARAREYVASGDKYAAEGKIAEAIVQYRNAGATTAALG